MRQQDLAVIRPDNLSKESREALERYEKARFVRRSEWGRFLFSTKLCQLQRTRVRQLLSRRQGLIDDVAGALRLDKRIVVCLVEGLAHMGYVEMFSGGGWGLQYRVINSEPPRFLDE